MIMTLFLKLQENIFSYPQKPLLYIVNYKIPYIFYKDCKLHQHNKMYFAAGHPFRFSPCEFFKSYVIGFYKL